MDNVARYPNGVLVHNSCVINPSICPLTGILFKLLHWRACKLSQQLHFHCFVKSFIFCDVLCDIFVLSTSKSYELCFGCTYVPVLLRIRMYPDPNKFWQILTQNHVPYILFIVDPDSVVKIFFVVQLRLSLMFWFRSQAPPSHLFDSLLE